MCVDKCARKCLEEKIRRKEMQSISIQDLVDVQVYLFWVAHITVSGSVLVQICTEVDKTHNLILSVSSFILFILVFLFIQKKKDYCLKHSK